MPGALLEAVVGNIVVATALAGAALLVSRCTRRPAFAHVLWLLVLLKLIMPSFFTVPIRCLPGEGEVRHALAWEIMLLSVWLAGALLRAVLSIQRVRRFVGLLRYSVAAPVSVTDDVARMAEEMRLHRMPRVRVLPGRVPPLVWSVGSSTLYYPTGLLQRIAPEGRLTLIAHELAHLRRWDHIVRWVECIALVVFWWCPLAWLARRELRRLEEEACDAEVCETLPDLTHAYALAVLETIDFLSGAARLPALASAMGDSQSLRTRFRTMLAGNRRGRLHFGHRLGLILVAFLALAASPRFERLPAIEAVASDLAKAPGSSMDFLEVLTSEEPGVGPTQYLPRPTELIAGEAGEAAVVAFAPDKSAIAVARGGVVAIQNLSEPTDAVSLFRYPGTVNAMAFSPDGARIVTAGDDGLARLWDTATGKLLHTLRGHERWIMAVAFAPDGRTLATGAYDRMIRIWDVATGKLVATLSGHRGGVRSLAFSADGRFLVSGDADHEARAWDAARRVVLASFRKHIASVRGVALSPNGERIASVSEDRTLRIWNRADGREIAPSAALPDQGTAVAFLPDGLSVIVGTASGHLLHFDANRGQTRQFIGVEPGESVTRPAHRAAISALFVRPKNDRLYSVAADGTVLMWTPAPAPSPVSPPYRSGAGSTTTAVALSPDGFTLAVGSGNGEIALLDAVTGRKKAVFFGHRAAITSLCFATEGRLVSAGADEQVQAWHLETGQAAFSLIQASTDLRIALSPDGRRLAISGPRLSAIAIHDAISGARLQQFGRFAGGATALAFTPTGDELMAGYADGFVRMWNPVRGEEIRAGSCGGQIDAIAFGTDRFTAAVAVNGYIRPAPEEESQPFHSIVFLDLRDGSVKSDAPTLAHPGAITTVAYRPDAGLVTAASDGNLYLWNARQGQTSPSEVRHIHADTVHSVAVAPDGFTVYSAGDGVARRWPLSAALAPPSGNRENMP